jgi:hypothetical protein
MILENRNEQLGVFGVHIEVGESKDLALYFYMSVSCERVTLLTGR